MDSKPLKLTVLFDVEVTDFTDLTAAAHGFQQGPDGEIRMLNLSPTEALTMAISYRLTDAVEQTPGVGAVTRLRAEMAEER
jgi:hypothetical protein